MKKSIFIALLFLATACNVAPLRNVENAPYNTEVKMNQVEQAIIRAGGSLGWKMKAKGKGHIEGMLFRRNHTAMVDVVTMKKHSALHTKTAPI